MPVTKAAQAALRSEYKSPPRETLITGAPVVLPSGPRRASLPRSSFFPTEYPSPRLTPVDSSALVRCALSPLPRFRGTPCVCIGSPVTVRFPLAMPVRRAALLQRSYVNGANCITLLGFQTGFPASWNPRKASEEAKRAPVAA
ncbi:hypothetical protein MRX96_023356 [Rhipicephalus microplus]